MQSGRRLPVPLRHLDHDRHATTRVGGGAPQAPRLDRHRRRPAQPDRRRLLARAARQRRAVQAVAAERPRARAQVRPRHPRRPSRPLRVRLRAGGPRHRHQHPRGGDVGARLRARHRFRRCGDPRGDLRDAGRRDQRGRAHLRQPALRQLRHQSPAARARDRRRRTAQQPPRCSDVGPLRARTVARSIPVGGSCACSWPCISRRCATKTCT